jgi:hypothetical protein
VNPEQAFRLALELSRLPGVRIDLWGGEGCRQVYRSFIRPHPRFPLVQRKRHGVALVAVPDTFAGYLAGGARQAVRTNRKRALERGYTFRRINPMEHMDEILAINSSTEARQGRPMEDGYLVSKAVRASFERAPSVFGVVDRKEALCAYLDLRTCGDVAILSRLLGHAELLDEGIMYLIVTETIRELIDQRRETGSPSWVMYDTWFGGRPGIRYFKQRLGFAPYRVRWRWVDR